MFYLSVAITAVIRLGLSRTYVSDKSLARFFELRRSNSKHDCATKSSNTVSNASKSEKENPLIAKNRKGDCAFGAAKVDRNIALCNSA